MKFPVARDVFEPLELSRQEIVDLEGLADSVLDETLQSATRLLENENGCVNEHAWKKLKQFDGLSLYRERTAGATGSRMRRGTLASRSNSALVNAPPSFLLVGQVLCGLDDLMYGMSTATAEEQRIRSSYVPDGIVDCQLIHEIHKPNKNAPYHHLNLQWLATTAGSVPLTRPRDYVVVDGAGTLDDNSLAPRVGYSLRHSVQLDDAQPLDHWKIVRGAMSICGVFHEVYPTVVHVYMKMTFEPRARGAINKSLATAAAIDYAAALPRMCEASQMKKLTAAVRATERSRNKPSSTEATDECENPLATSYGSNATSVRSSIGHRRMGGDSCGSCCNHVRYTAAEEDEATCELCRQVQCRHCRIRKELSFVGRYNRVHRSRHTFCSDCISRTIHRNATQVATFELAQNERLFSSVVATERSTEALKAAWRASTLTSDFRETVTYSVDWSP